jgi:hypothetical protein
MNQLLISLGKEFTPSHGTRSPSIIIVPICQICKLGDHVATICPRIGNLKP